jgi:hypothetical protein
MTEVHPSTCQPVYLAVVVRTAGHQPVHPSLSATYRLVVPILDEAVIGPIEDLELRTAGVMEVRVGEARGLPGGGGWLTGAHPQVMAGAGAGWAEAEAGGRSCSCCCQPHAPGCVCTACVELGAA